MGRKGEKYLTPVIFTEKYFRDIQITINKIFWKILYDPILKAISEDRYGIELTNAENPVAAAIRSGKLNYIDGVISGTYNARISAALKRMGATFDSRSSTWRVQNPSADIQLAAAETAAKNARISAIIIEKLDEIDAFKIVGEADLMGEYERETVKMTNDVNRTIRAIAIPPELSKQAVTVIAQEWSLNLELYIRKWADENILDLRQKVQANAFRGQRSGNLVKLIQDNYGTSRAKARFLARQETSLLMSKIKEQQYADVGITEYIWSGANDERERPDHKALNGKRFSFSNPPVTDLKTGARNNPGEDYNCRCVAKPVMPS